MPRISEKLWRSQFMMHKHKFIHKNEQSKNRRISPFTLALSAVIRFWDSPIFEIDWSKAMLALLPKQKFSAKNITHKLPLFFVWVEMVIKKHSADFAAHLTSSSSYHAQKSGLGWFAGAIIQGYDSVTPGWSCIVLQRLWFYCAKVKLYRAAPVDSS